MAERYTRIFKDEKEWYWTGTPIVVSACALLRDNKTDGTVAQVKFRNIGAKRIKALTAEIVPFDTAGRPLDSRTKYTYLDLNIGREEFFGSQTPITMPDATTREIEVNIIEIVFVDNAVLDCSENPFKELPERQKLEHLDIFRNKELLVQYKIDTSSKAVFFPVRFEDLWLCSCGSINYKDEEKCHSCNVSFQKQIDLFNKDTLETESQERLDKLEYERKSNILKEAKEYMGKKPQLSGYDSAQYENAISELVKIKGFENADELIEECESRIKDIKEQKEAEEKEHQLAFAKKKRKIKIVLAIACSMILLSGAVLALWNSVIQPFIDYNKAIELYKNGEYEEAKATFTALNGYKDSEAQITKCEAAFKDHKYNAAAELYNSGKYDEAITAFTALDGYKDSESQRTKCETAIKDVKYNAAVELYNSGKYDEAITAFTALDGYKDSETQLEKCYIGKYGEEKFNFIQKAKFGETCKFGSYEQDNNTSNGKEDIEWLVLDIEGNKVLVISKYALDCQPYNTSSTGATWETCSLRKWLNGTFISTAFSTDEQNCIISSTVIADKQPEYSTYRGNNTTDKVFLLSINEVNKYFGSDEARKCVPTDYAIAQGAYTSSTYFTGGRATCWWWLRSPGGFNSKYAAIIYGGGSVKGDGSEVSKDNCAVRPAMWIDIGD